MPSTAKTGRHAQYLPRLQPDHTAQPNTVKLPALLVALGFRHPARFSASGRHLPSWQPSMHDENRETNGDKRERETERNQQKAACVIPGRHWPVANAAHMTLPHAARMAPAMPPRCHDVCTKKSGAEKQRRWMCKRAHGSACNRQSGLRVYAAQCAPPQHVISR